MTQLCKHMEDMVWLVPALKSLQTEKKNSEKGMWKRESRMQYTSKVIKIMDGVDVYRLMEYRMENTLLDLKKKSLLPCQCKNGFCCTFSTGHLKTLDL